MELRKLRCPTCRKVVAKTDGKHLFIEHKDREKGDCVLKIPLTQAQIDDIAGLCCEPLTIE